MQRHEPGRRADIAGYVQVEHHLELQIRVADAGRDHRRADFGEDLVEGQAGGDQSGSQRC